MLFCTYPFFVFLGVVLLAIRASETSPRVQKLVLIVASNFFYGYWDARFLALLWFSTAMDWGVGWLIEREKRPRLRRAIFIVSIVGNLALLGFFKYFDFFQDSAARLLDTFGIAYNPTLLRIALPVGISFYTFQSMSYVIDVYRGQMKANRSLLDYAQYVMYFPQLVAGPIERASHLMPQLAIPQRVRLPNVLSGSLLILWGCFKKALVADIAGLQLVNPVFNQPEGGLYLPDGGLQLALATIAFSFQIYMDFSGYCDVARGTSRCFGIELVENFEAPYFAANIADFWRRWHISLSTWFRDYLYIPLGGNRGGAAATIRNLSITMFLCGLWHGAKWTFVAWGCYHGLLLLLHRLATGEQRKRTPHYSESANKLVFIGKALGTYLLVCYGWMLFRLDSDKLIVPYTVKLFSITQGLDDPAYVAACVSMARTLVLLGVGVYVANWLQHRATVYAEQVEDLPHLSPVALGVASGLLLALILALGTMGERLPFIYFQF